MHANEEAESVPSPSIQCESTSVDNSQISVNKLGIWVDT